VIGRAVDVLPSVVSAADRDEVERSLVREAAKNDAEIVAAVALHIDAIVNPDGDYDEANRARRRGLHLGAQGHYHTEATDTGRLAWTEGTQPPDINHAHHPDELLHGNTDPPGEDEK
jgi:Domain of unknown function (DUF222)